MYKNSATKSQSFSLMKKFENMYGDNTANYYKALLNALYNKQIIPSVIVGGGLKNPVGVAVKYLKKKIAEAERAGNIGQGNVTVSKPAKPTLSETDGYYYFVKDDSSKTLLYFGHTPSHRGADRAVNRARQLVMTLISYGDHYFDNLQEMLNSNRKLSNLPAEKKSIATKGYNENKVKSGWLSASSGSHGLNYETRDFVSYNTEHLTRKEMKLLAKFLKALKNTKRGSDRSLRGEVIRLAHSKPELRKHLLPLIKKEGGSVTMKVSEGYPYIRYRIENEGKRTAGCMVLFSYRMSKKSVITQKLISDLNEFEKQCFSMTKSLEKVFKMKGLGSLNFKENFVRIELGNQYPLIGKYTAYFHIENDKVNDIRLVLEDLFGATDIRS